MIKQLILFLASCMPIKAYSQDTSLAQIFDTIQKAQLISNQFGFAEGPAVNKQGDIFFTDQPNDKIWKYDIHGKLSQFMDKTGRSNGLYFTNEGNIIACADEKNELWEIYPDKKHKTLLSYLHGKKLNGPNDVWIDKDDGIFFTDPYYQRDYWTRKKPDIDKQNVYYLPNGAQQPVIADSTLQKPNGIAGTADGSVLYVSDIQAGKIFRYRINAGGILSQKKLFANSVSDGMTLDNHGNLYLCGNGVTIFNASGKKLGHIDIPEKWTGNICFGGKERNILFITASKSVYIIHTLVKGIE